MLTIYHNFPIRTTPELLFEAISSPRGLDAWWSNHCSGNPAMGANYSFDFGPEYQWIAVVTSYEFAKAFELEFVQSDLDWNGSKVGFLIEPDGEFTQLKFYHTGWPTLNEHFKISNYCWAMYLRLLKRYLEFGECVAYEERLNV
ncbi:MAG: SRPBCC family protein [Bacteroidota bacterium]